MDSKKTKINRKGYSQEKLNSMHKNGYYNYLCSDDFLPVYNFIAETILFENANSVLDVGCWNGIFYKVLNNKGYKSFYLGFDLSESAINEGKKLYGNNNTKFLTETWDNFQTDREYHTIYFGGVFYYIDQKINFIEKFIKQVKPKVIVIQDLQSTNLSEIDKYFEKVETKYFELKMNVNNQRNLRQVKIIKLKK